MGVHSGSEYDLEATSTIVLSTWEAQDDHFEQEPPTKLRRLLHVILSWALHHLIALARHFRMARLFRVSKNALIILIRIAKFVTMALSQQLGIRLWPGHDKSSSNMVKHRMCTTYAVRESETFSCLEPFHNIYEPPPEYTKVSRESVLAEMRPGVHVEQPKQQAGDSGNYKSECDWCNYRAWIATMVLVFCVVILHAFMNFNSGGAFINNASLQTDVEILMIAMIYLISGFLCYIFLTGVAVTTMRVLMV